MVRAYHLTLTACGFWLPNDPRGSWSDFIGAWELLKYGPATKVNTSRSLAHDLHDVEQRKAAKRALKYPPVEWNGEQARAVARGFAEYTHRADLIVRACAIMPDHVHFVIDRHWLSIESIATQLKAAATQSVFTEGIHSLASYQESCAKRPPKMWARGEWKVFLNTHDDISRAIEYVENNLVRDGLKRQRWKLVTTPA